MIVFIFIVCSIYKITAQNKSTLSLKFTWKKTRKLSYSDYKLRFEDDTNGYLARYLDLDGHWKDTILPSYAIDSGFLYYGVDDSIGHSEVILYPSYSIDKNVMRYNIYAEFDPYKSYLKVRTPDMLEHEQIHFNLVEAYARKIRKYIRSCTIAKIDSIPIVISNYYDEQIAQHNIYDNDAWVDFFENGTLYHSDSLWKKRIDKQLDSLKAYEKSEGKVILK